jgi:predicted PurR-regulated permease PerM
MTPPGPSPDGNNAMPPTGLVYEDRLRLVKLGILTLVFLALCVWLAIPLLPALTWGMALAIIAWPLHVWMSRHIHWPGAAAALTAAVVVLVIASAGVFVTYELAREAASQAEQMKERAAGDVIREAMSNAPGLRGVVEWADRVQIDLDRALRQYIGSFTADASALIHGSVHAVIQFVVAVFFLFHFLRDRPAILAGVRTLLPLSRVESDRVFRSVADSVHANLYATVVTAIIAGVGGGLMFWALGLPSPVLWGVVMFILSVLPIVGTFLVWGPAAAYLALIGNWPGALALIAWGVGFWFIVDNYIYVRLAGQRMRMHQVPTLLAFLGGLAIFGVSGMILGPAIAAVTMALLDLWRQTSRDAPIGPGVDPTGEAVVGAVADEPAGGAKRAGQVVDV